MSSDEIAISAQHISKRYPIYAAPQDRLKQYVLPPLRRCMGLKQRHYFQEFWALHDISFEIRKGETVGLIGRNGAGKSTLLQVLCGTLPPTSGTYRTQGRIAALLELGSGFNPEFTGRQNVYLNAAILGLTKAEIDARFDQIAAFADIGDFIEQPVKTYSSGMYVRLAFAVIAHVDADILVVDEALAVGDAIFTQKCMRFIRAFQERGTLLFVSHDTGSVQNLCKRALWLDKGTVRLQGPSQTVSEAYLQYTLQSIYGDELELQANEAADTGQAVQAPPSLVAQTPVAEPALASAAGLHQQALPSYSAEASVSSNLFTARGFFSGQAEITDIQLTNLSPGAKPGIYRGWDRLRLTVTAQTQIELSRPIIGFLLRDRLGQDLLGENTLFATQLKPVIASAGAALTATFEFILPMLKDGEYAVMCSIADGDLHNHVQHHWLHDALILVIRNSQIQYGLVGVPFTKIELETTP